MDIGAGKGGGDGGASPRPRSKNWGVCLFVCLYLFPYQLKTKEIYNINTLNIQIRKRRITQIQQYSYNTAGLPWGPTLIINILNFKS